MTEDISTVDVLEPAIVYVLYNIIVCYIVFTLQYGQGFIFSFFFAKEVESSASGFQ